MFRSTSYPIGSLICAVLLLSCADQEPSTTRFQQKWVEFNGSYTNDDISGPLFIPDPQTMGQVTFDTVFCAPDDRLPLVHVKFRNLSVKDSLGNTEVDSLRIEELRGNNWIQDVEFDRDIKRLTTMAVVLVLDASRSLGDDFALVQDYANQFIDIVKKNIPESRIGVVVFSDTVVSMDPTVNAAVARAFISGAPRGQFTALYAAMLRGIELLNATAADNKAMVTFTDGINNYRVYDPDTVIQEIERKGIHSYTIGLQGRDGGLDEAVLNRLANREFRVASNVTVLNDIFQRFSRVVTNVYDVTYSRVRSPVAQSAPVRIRFRFRTIPSF